MTQVFYLPKSNEKKQQAYCYINNFKQIVIAKINGLKNRHCERVIFPNEKFIFIADKNCELEILQQTNRRTIRHTLSCSHLQAIDS